MSDRKIGFAALTPEQRRAIAIKGGRSVKPENRAYSRDRRLAHIAACKARGREPEAAVVDQIPLFEDER